MESVGTVNKYKILVMVPMIVEISARDPIAAKAGIDHWVARDVIEKGKISADNNIRVLRIEGTGTDKATYLKSMPWKPTPTAA